MKALSIRQPWAWLIVSGFKDVENRAWPTNFRGRVYVHAGQKADDDGYRFLPEAHKKALANGQPAFLHKGAIIGEVDIIGCVQDSKSPWAEQRQYHFLLSNPEKYENPIPCKGRLRFFEPDLEDYILGGMMAVMSMFVMTSILHRRLHKPSPQNREHNTIEKPGIQRPHKGNGF